ncbi:MAG: DUF1816 domain-containing protein [Nostoc sp.]|uniref:DUF1816 domain-containing protein n=1 Tax=Nostoc sp. TaxID=1180 RepID=UPI002FFAFEE7
MKTLWHNFKEVLINTFDSIGLAWWVEIVTQNPRCTYYFGPFLTSSDAKLSSIGYIEDLEVEGATGITMRVKRCKPNTLTIAEDLGERFDRKVQPAFGGQI